MREEDEEGVVWLKVAFAVIIAVVCLIGGHLPGRLSPDGVGISYATCFSCGVLLGAALLHLLAEAAEDWVVIAGTGYPWHFFAAGVGCLACIALTESVGGHSHGHAHAHHGGDHGDQGDHGDHGESAKLIDHGGSHPARALPFIVALTMSFECFFTGVALGVENTVVGAVAVFLAIVTHVWAEAFVIVTTAIRADLSPWDRNKALFGFCAASPLGVFVGMMLDEGGVMTSRLTVLLRSFCGGLFLFVALAEILPEEMHSHAGNKLAKLLMVVNGFAFMALVAIGA